MVFVFIEDGGLSIIENSQEANVECEGVDVESEVFEFYDENGVYLKPIFTKPNKYKKHLFGLFTSIESGEFNLVSAPNECETSFELMLQDVVYINPNKWFKTKEEILSKYQNVT